MATARADLDELAWDDPQTGRVVPAAEYLSGDVRAKLAAAEIAAADPRWADNVEALSRVVPVDLGPAEIDARLVAPWIPTGTWPLHRRGPCPPAVVEYVPVTATWAVQVPSWQRHTVAATSTSGTSRADAISLVVASLNQRSATVYDALDDGRRILTPAEPCRLLPAPGCSRPPSRQGDPDERTPPPEPPRPSTNCAPNWPTPTPSSPSSRPASTPWRPRSPSCGAAQNDPRAAA